MIKRYINKLSKTQKITCLALILIFFWLLIVSGSTLARFKNRSTLIETINWDGSAANSYRNGNGTSSNPYIISNGAELSYLINQLESNNYENTYFELNNDIILNPGILSYDEETGITYTINSQKYYVKEYSNEYYTDSNYSGNNIGTINILSPLNGFKGHFNGNNHIIYGLYQTSNDADNLGLFTNLEGIVENLYVENSVIYGGLVTGGISSNTKDATISNSLFNGYVVGEKNNITKNLQYSIVDQQVNISSTGNGTINITNTVPFVGSSILANTITGNYSLSETSGNEVIKVNNQEVSGGTFSINLGTSIIDELDIEVLNGISGATIDFTNLSGNLTYNYAVAGGIVGYSQNSVFNQVASRGNVYGNSISGGVVGVATSNISINQSYNSGSVIANYTSGGLVGVVEKNSDNVTITKSYNSGPVESSNYGGFLGTISDNEAEVRVSNSFNASNSNYCINTISNSTVTVNKLSYTSGYGVKTGHVNGFLSIVSQNNLYSENYMISNFGFDKFVSFDDFKQNSNNVWVYDTDSLPILFIDDSSNALAQIKLNGYSWDNLSNELNTIKLNSGVLFSIDNIDSLSNVKEKYYYISDSDIVLSSHELDNITSWSIYSNAIQLSGEGSHIIYSKIVDNNNNISYINSDLIIIDQTSPSLVMTLNNHSWNSYSEDLDYVYTDSSNNVSISVSDNFDNVDEIKYYISDHMLTSTDLDNLDESLWNVYNSNIEINSMGTKIIYAKATDEAGNTGYANTGYIVYNGYSMKNIVAGRNSTSYIDANNISSKSAVTLNYEYLNSSNSLDGTVHNLVSSILLPEGTKITLIDYTKNKIYTYHIATNEDLYNYENSCNDDSCAKVATYPFTLFKEIGTAQEKYFDEVDYYGDTILNEKFSIVLDFENATITNNYENVKISLNLCKDNLIIKPTLLDTIKEFNIYNKADATISLTTSSQRTINLNSDSTTDINFNSKLTYSNSRQTTIVDTRFENQKMGLLINLVDNSGNIVDKEHLKSLIFKIDDKEYYPSEDNNIYIDLGNKTFDVSKSIAIKTSENNDSLEDGNYSLIVQNYYSYDGKHNYILGNDRITVSVKMIRNSSNIKYSFDVLMDDDDLIVNKSDLSKEVTFNILQSGYFSDPNIKISLYEKSVLSAYDKTYSLINLNSYLPTPLEECGNNTYYAIKNPVTYHSWSKKYNILKLNLIPSNFRKNEYKYVFELYDGAKKIGTIEKYFIVK